MIYFTSDLHLGHEKTIEFSNRPFESVNEMNDKLIESINDVVLKKAEFLKEKLKKAEISAAF